MICSQDMLQNMSTAMCIFGHQTNCITVYSRSSKTSDTFKMVSIHMHDHFVEETKQLLAVDPPIAS